MSVRFQSLLRPRLYREETLFILRYETLRLLTCLLKPTCYDSLAFFRIARLDPESLINDPTLVVRFEIDKEPPKYARPSYVHDRHDPLPSVSALIPPSRHPTRLEMNE